MIEKMGNVQGSSFVDKLNEVIDAVNKLEDRISPTADPATPAPEMVPMSVVEEVLMGWPELGLVYPNPTGSLLSAIRSRMGEREEE